MNKQIMAAAGALAVLFSAAANATLIGYDSCSGANDCLIAPTDAPIPNPIVANPNNGLLLGWDELQNVTLTSNLYVNRVADTGASFIGNDSNGYYIKAGTIVSSHYFQWDPGAGSSSTVTARMNFDSEIFAFITSDANLFASDAQLGLPGFDYADFGLRGLESGDTTNFGPGGDYSLVDIRWTASSPGDWTRLITAYSPGGNPVPAPAAAAMLIFAIAALGFRRKKA